MWRQKSASSNAIKGEWQWLTIFVTHFIIQLYAYVLLQQAYKPQWPLSVAKYCGTVTTLNTGGSTSNLRVSKCTTTTTKKKFVQQQQKMKHCFQPPPPPYLKNLSPSLVCMQGWISILVIQTRTNWYKASINPSMPCADSHRKIENWGFNSQYSWIHNVAEFTLYCWFQLSLRFSFS